MTSSGSVNGIIYGINADFSGEAPPGVPANILNTDGELWIGSTALNGGGTHVNVGQIISSSLVVDYSSPNITIETNGGGSPIEQITVDNSTAPGTNPVLPTGSGNLTISGGQVANASLANVIQTHSLAANSFAVTIQRSTTSAATDSTKNGVSHFDSAKFSLDGNAFVTTSGTGIGSTITGDSGGALSPTGGNWNVLGGTGCNTSGSGSTLTINVTGGGLEWSDITSATQTLAVNIGYITNRGGGVTYTLPATASEGDVIRVAGKSGAWTIAQNANQQINVASSSSTVGVGGSIASTNAGDCVELLCTTGGASTVWRAISSMGNITVV